jgi:hypothetical protein
MNAKWNWVAPLALVFVLSLFGCRTTQPDLKPPPQPEVFNSPSTTASLSGYPTQAFKFDDPATRTDLDGNKVQQARAMGGGGGGAMPGPASLGGPGTMR